MHKKLHEVKKSSNVCFNIKSLTVSWHAFCQFMKKYDGSNVILVTLSTWQDTKREKYESESCILFIMLSFCCRNFTVLSFSSKQPTKEGLTSHPQARLVSTPWFSKILKVSLRLHSKATNRGLTPSFIHKLLHAPFSSKSNTVLSRQFLQAIKIGLAPSSIHKFTSAHYSVKVVPCYYDRIDKL